MSRDHAPRGAHASSGSRFRAGLALPALLLALLLASGGPAAGARAGAAPRPEGHPDGAPPVDPGPPQSVEAAAAGDARATAPADAQVDALRTELQGAIGQPGWSGAEWSVLAYSLERGDTLFALRPDLALAPASNMKLVTSAAALHFLGPGYRYLTFLLADGPVRDGVLEGDLILYGTGDPTISDRFHATRTAVFDSLAGHLRAMGIRRIRGDVVGDGSFFSGPQLAEGWNPDDLNDWFAAPVSGLAFNENVVTLRVQPAEANAPPRVLTIPANAQVSVRNLARTVSTPPRERLELDRARPQGPIRVTGEIPAGGRDVWRQITVSHPGTFAASVLKNALDSAGIAVDGAARGVEQPASSSVTGRTIWAPALREDVDMRLLAVHESPPLTEILAVVNKKSHNLFSEVVLRTIGRTGAGDGSFEGGARAVQGFLTETVGIDPSQVTVIDGSGLSSRNRMSAQAFVALLAHVANSPLWDPLWESLPEAGNPEELRRMYQTAAAGNLRAKTGTIENVSALSGLVRSSNGERILFSIISNRVPSTWGAKRVEDQIGSQLASFERPFEPAAVPADRLARRGPESDTATLQGEAAARIAATEDDGAAPEETVEETRWHTIVAGENFTVIARRHGVRPNALVEANPDLSPQRLQPGQRIRIPVAGEAVSGPDPATTRDPRTHRVRSGESFWSIARRYGVSMNELVEANPGRSPETLQPGQTLNIPEGGNEGSDGS